MANKRMLNIQIIDSDNFMDMSATAQLLYFQLVLRADDDGFVGNPKTIMRMIGGNVSDMQQLAQRQYIIAFPSGVIVIRHWRLHNTIRKDTYHETIYTEEKSQLSLDGNEIYVLSDRTLLEEDQNHAETEYQDPLDDPVTEPYRTRNEVVTDSLQPRTEPVTDPYRTRNETETQIRLDKTRTDKTRTDKTRTDKTSQDKTRIEQTRPEKEEKEKHPSGAKRKHSASATHIVRFPEDAELDEAFNNFAEMRKKIRAPLTENAEKLIVNKLQKLANGNREDMIAILNQSTENSWRGVFPLRREEPYKPRAQDNGPEKFNASNFLKQEIARMKNEQVGNG